MLKGRYILSKIERSVLLILLFSISIFLSYYLIHRSDTYTAQVTVRVPSYDVEHIGMRRIFNEAQHVAARLVYNPKVALRVLQKFNPKIFQENPVVQVNTHLAKISHSINAESGLFDIRFKEANRLLAQQMAQTHADALLFELRSFLQQEFQAHKEKLSSESLTLVEQLSSLNNFIGQYSAEQGDLEARTNEQQLLEQVELLRTKKIETESALLLLDKKNVALNSESATLADTLLEKQLTLESYRATLGPKHPRRLTIEQEIADLTGELESTKRADREFLKAKLQIIDLQKTKLRSQLLDLQHVAIKRNTDDVLTAFRYRAQVLESRNEALLKEQLTLEESIRNAGSASVVSAAHIQNVSYAPGLLLCLSMLALSCLVTTFLYLELLRFRKLKLRARIITNFAESKSSTIHKPAPKVLVLSDPAESKKSVNM